MNCIIRGVRVIDPVAQLDAVGQDVWISDGRIIAVYKQIDGGTLPVIDLTPPPGGVPCILCPGFIDLHTHVREPNVGADGEERGDQPESMLDAALTAAAGGFTHIVTMANTSPPVDSPERVAAQAFRALPAPVQVLTAAAMTRGLEGHDLVNMEACAASGAVAFSDDGRNAASQELLSSALIAAAGVRRPVMIHPEDESLVTNSDAGHDFARAWPRPSKAEVEAVARGIAASASASVGHLHLQHLSTSGAVDLLRQAKYDDLNITAEVTPHHLGMWLPLDEPPRPASLTKVNPPLRSERDRAALIQALREGLIDAVATDHAPHRRADKTDDYDASAAGIMGLETALATCLTFGGMGGDWIPVLIERLTSGPFKVLGDAAGLRVPRLRIGEAATCVVFDPAQEWVVGDSTILSKARNTPLWGQTLRGRVLLTLVDGALVYQDPQQPALNVAGQSTSSATPIAPSPST